MKYDIQVNHLNPVEYLACCGVFEILAHFDSNATCWWEVEPQPRFWLESEIDEGSLLTCLKEAFSDWNQWHTEKGTPGVENESERLSDEAPIENEEVREDAASVEGDDTEGISLKPTFYLNDKTVVLPLDWWYETLTQKQEIKKKSGWKMYAGQQTASKISHDMTIAAGRLLRKNSITRISDLIKLSAGMTGRFGFDPRSSRNARDAGYSANDLKLPIATCPFAELLTTIAIQHFFPQRTLQAGGITSSRGWIENDVFQYALWKTPLPVRLARMAAIGAGINKEAVIPLQSERANRDKYSNFRMATTTSWKTKNKTR